MKKFLSIIVLIMASFLTAKAQYTYNCTWEIVNTSGQTWAYTFSKSGYNNTVNSISPTAMFGYLPDFFDFKIGWHITNNQGCSASGTFTGPAAATTINIPCQGNTYQLTQTVYGPNPPNSFSQYHIDINIQ